MKQTDWAISPWLIGQLVPAHPGRQSLCSVSAHWQLACFPPQLDKLYTYPFTPSLAYSVAQLVAHPPVHKCRNKKTIHVWYKVYPKINPKHPTAQIRPSSFNVYVFLSLDCSSWLVLESWNQGEPTARDKPLSGVQLGLVLPCKLPAANLAFQRCISVNGCTNLQG